MLDHSGHGYLADAALVAALFLALVLVAMVARATDACRGRVLPRTSLWPFAVLPFFGFCVQEYLERFIHSGSLPLDTGLEPVFLIGLLLQLPFALAAFVLARALLHVADQVGRLFARRRVRPPLRTSAPILRTALPADLPRLSVLALGRAERGPPLSFSLS